MSIRQTQPIKMRLFNCWAVEEEVEEKTRDVRSKLSCHWLVAFRLELGTSGASGKLTQFDVIMLTSLFSNCIDA